MPFGLGAFGGDTDKIAERLREVKARGGISRFVMSGPGHAVRVNGVADIATYAKIGRKIHALSEAAAPYGKKIVSSLVPTMNWGAGHPWRKFTFANGNEGSAPRRRRNLAVRLSQS